MQIALLFGSFNPVHYGHVMLGQYVLNFASVDEVWYVVSPHNPFKNVADLAPAEHRLRMVSLAVAESTRLKVSDVELHLPLPSYTVQTIRQLQADYPHHTFSIVIGGDNLDGLSSWHSANELLHGRRIIVYPRPRQVLDPQPIQALGAKVDVLNAPQIDISSTMLRQWVSKNIDISNFTHPNVVKYIRENNLYLSPVNEK